MILLLTGCINPNGMQFTSLNNPKEREEQYIEAIRFYLDNTSYPIVFTENSGTDLSSYFQNEIASGRLECLTFNGNQNKERGKGYGECEIIQYALDNSKFISSSHQQQVAKITGRLIIKNLKAVYRLYRILSNKRTVSFAINSDFTFPDSRFIIAPSEFYHTLIDRKEYINDAQGYFFEHALCDIIKQKSSFPYSPFFIQPQIVGISGTTGKVYNEDASSKSLSFTLKYAKYTISQLLKFKRLYR